MAKQKSDTTKVIELAIRTAFYHQNLPDMDPLFYSYYFGDSILFTTNSLSLEVLPKSIDSFNFKILSENKICLLIRADSNVSKVPNYLSVGAFEKSDSDYYVSIQSLSCLPFGNGGSIGLHIVKENDSLIVTEKISNSLN